MDSRPRRRLEQRDAGGPGAARDGRAVRLLIGGVLVVLIAGACSLVAQQVSPRDDYQPVAAALEKLIEQEMAEKGLTAFSIALVDGDRTVWSRGFGAADPDRKISRTADTIFRTSSLT